MADDLVQRRAERIAALKAQKEKLAAKILREEGKARSIERKRDTRRKIVVGGAVLSAIEKDPDLAQRIRQLLAAQVGRPIDREVIADLLLASPAALNAVPQETSAA